MKRALVLVALAVAGCTSSSHYRSPQTRVTPGPDLAATPDCAKGNQTCINSIVAEMQRRYTRLASTCDHRAAFALMYMRVTEGVKKPDTKRFDDEAYLRRLDAQFARLYFKAFDSYQAGRPTDPAWRIAFESAGRGMTTGIGDMLLGMNAHISNDLPFAAVRAGVSAKRRSDFDAVNDLLGDVQAPMIREESTLLDPSVARATLPYLGVHGGEIATVISGWRTEAWQNARALQAAAPGPERNDVAARIRAAAAQRAQVIQALASNRLLGEDARARDTYCRTSGAGRTA
ncbi:MAG: hypothetical protein QOJ29_4622 [Thermoleophilaceae bacterium]|jgi:hypothetical protein|nr:hypothetical protein [Thermoleophilaceae bacterium]